MHRPSAVTCLTLGLTLSACAGEPAEPVATTTGALGAASYEVWLVDQSNSFGKGYGGKIYIYDGRDLQGDAAANATPTDAIDLAAGTASLCLAKTGANPVRPHMILFNSTHSHGVLSFVASGHVVIFDAATREPVACFRTEVGAGDNRQAHAAFPTEDDQYIVVANQNGKLLERIDTDYATGTFTQVPAATLNLATCTTPNGKPCQDPDPLKPELRPDNAPICPVPLPNGQVVVTLRGGGMFIVDPATEPMSIVGEYDMAHISGNGCGGIVIEDNLFITSGGGTPSNLYTYEVYALPSDGYSVANPANEPAPVTVHADDADHRDAHGVTEARVTLGNSEASYLWVADRGLGLMTTYDAVTFDKVAEIPLGDSHDPDHKITPDLVDTNPAGNRIFASLRGPKPLSGDAHVSVGSVPGLGIFEVQDNGANGVLKAMIPISNVDAGGVERADGHGVRVRRK